MGERNLDFDRIIDRRNTDCLKYDFAKRRGKPEDVLPLWVADMDFPTSSYVLDALQERVAHGIFGYTEIGDSYFEAVAGWMERKHGWQVKQDWLVKTPGVVFGLAMAVKAFTEKGDSILIQQPVYYPFKEVIEDNDRQVVSSDLVLGSDNRYHINFADFEQKIIDNQVKLFILCSPHNPVGRVWKREELLRIGELCLKYGVLAVSDEIHQGFVYGENKHLVFANLAPEFEKFSITCTSPAKTFNLAGLQVSNLFIPNPTLQEAFRKQIAASGYSQLNTLGLTAGEAAYRYGEEWHNGVIDYLEQNIIYLKSYLNQELPEIRMIEPEGTYLVWLDFRGLGLTVPELEHMIIHKAKLWLDSGAIFGAAGEGFQRINIACPRATLKQALEQLKQAVKEIG
ncbi:MAG: pyridoxal phosphate-dependent aminotransferase [Clostridia bacterium]|nr:pyridoxal phosphate-dependent aminotransferase [Clostridia bacterium]